MSVNHTRPLAYHLLIAVALAAAMGACALTLLSEGQLTSKSRDPDRSIQSVSEIFSLLERSALPGTDSSQIRSLAQILPYSAIFEERSPEETAAWVFPSPSEVLAMLARDRDVDDYLENASDPGAAGTYYQRVVELVPSMKPLRPHMEELFSGVYEGSQRLGLAKDPLHFYPESAAYKNGVTLPRLSTKPRERDYDFSHTFALDIFLKNVHTLPFSTLEKGPVIFSLTDGIVIASDSSWQGGEELAGYRSGGITPKAGNGVIVYSPEKRKYYLYFHLYDVFVSAGMVISRGHPLGHGGNTGTNARKPGHGEHLHLEIYDADRGRFLRNHEIADIVF